MEHTFAVLERSPFPNPLLGCSHRCFLFVCFAINNLGRFRIVAFESDLFAYFYALDALFVAALHSKRRALCRCWLVHWVILGSSKHWQGGQSLREENQRDSWLGRSFGTRICCDRSFKQPASHQWQHQSNRPSHPATDVQSDFPGPTGLQVAEVPLTRLKPSSQLICTVSIALLLEVEEIFPWGIVRSGHVAAVVSGDNT